MKKNLFAIGILFMFSSSLFSEEDWYWQYPKPQGNTLNDIHILDENTAIAVGELGTIIQTTDGGNTWDVQHHAGGTSLPLYGVCFVDENIGWAAGGTWWTDQRVLLKTEDGGKTWNTVEPDVEGYTLPFQDVYFVSSDTGFVFGEDGLILRTTDGGNTWTSQIIGFELHRLNSACFSSKETGWLVGYGYYGNTIFKTTDCGLTWEQQMIEPIVYDQRDVQFIDDSTGFIVGQTGTFLKTHDGGQTWEYQNLSERYQKWEYAYFYSLHFVNADTGRIAGGDYYGYILKTTDGGKNWVEEKRNEEGPFYKIRFSDPKNGWAIGRYGVIYETADGGENWISQREEQYQFNSIYFVDGNTGWAVGDKGIILHTDDGGLYWYEQNHNDSLSFSSVYAIDNQNVFAVGAVIKGNWPSYTRNGVILQTTNSGKTWAMQTFDTLTEFSAIVFINDSTGWITVTNGTLLKTTNKGDAWKQVVSGLGTILDNIQFIDENTGWISFYTGKSLLKTIDGGKNWVKQFIDSSLSMYSFHFVNDNKGWAAGSYSGKSNIFKTTDGDNWITSGTPPISHYSSVYFINENIGWVVGGFRISEQSKSTIIKTADSGNTWHEQKSPSTNELSDIYFLKENIGWVVGDGIFKTTTGGSSAVDVMPEVQSSLPVNISLSNNYPNPFNGETIIKYSIGKQTFVTLTIFDLLGRKIETLINKFQPAGTYEIVWNARALPSAVYVCRLQAEATCKTQKLILIK